MNKTSITITECVVHCPRCYNVEGKIIRLKKGQALKEIYGMAEEGPYMLPTGQSKIVDVMKCPVCGHSKEIV